MKELFFSVLLVVKNEERYIRKLLDGVLQQEFPQDSYEILVVDGMSSDRTKDIVEDVSQKNPGKIRLFDNPKETLPTGWNLAINNAKGQYILRVDGHTMIPTNFLMSYYDLIQRKPDMDCVGGVIRTEGKGFWGTINAYVYSHPMGVGNSMFRITSSSSKWEGQVDTVPYGAYKREVFQKVGLFNENLRRSEDIEFHARVRNDGGQFYLSSDIASTYFARDSLKAFVQKSYADGKWGIIASSGTRGVMRFRQLAPLMAFMTGTALGVGALFNDAFLISLLTLSAVYLMMIGVSSLGVIEKHGFRAYVPTVMQFFLLHFTRGLGLVGGYFSKQYWKVKTGHEKWARITTDHVS
ncbi:glycosyltransferase family 2 protein [Guptibacillus hwajinpoensis]|uniref:Glycosyltransferase involved in cell wall biosynthesis n=2 Tax=Guptibacillus hwajinpoensis TaxID=208199 RepID=A0ABU0JZU2_9BACL|nr:MULTISPECIES: glycosyltransferase family 2 protein [Alkalihalobacillus]KMM36877.1 glycosyl transferase [Alkalihalobacillus macyae]MDQ0482614.1 glycosyltransferase involved in cell wall biosynthesis [Alkalihalobacillus hemicentroti]